jgi:hypothetical protein
MQQNYSYASNELGSLVIYGMIGVPTDAASPIAQKLYSFANLPIGWDYGSGGPIPIEAISRALIWEQFLRAQGFFDNDAFPGGNGEVVISATLGDHYIEVIIEPNNTTSVAYDFQRKQIFYRLNLSFSEAMQAITEAAGRIWNASDYYISVNTIRNRGSSLDQHLEIQKTTGFSPWWDQTASILLDRASATTSGTTINSTPESWTTPQFSGSFNPVYFRQATR